MEAVDFRKKHTKIIEVVGYVDGNGKLQVNMSYIYSKLVKEAAKCKQFASDIIYDIAAIEDSISDIHECMTSNTVIGFRESGTDGNAYMRNRVKKYPFVKFYANILMLTLSYSEVERKCSIRLFTLDMDKIERNREEFLKLL